MNWLKRLFQRVPSGYVVLTRKTRDTKIDIIDLSNGSGFLVRRSRKTYCSLSEYYDMDFMSSNCYDPDFTFYSTPTQVRDNCIFSNYGDACSSALYLAEKYIEDEKFTCNMYV